MQDKALESQTSIERVGQETGTEPLLDRKDPVASWTQSSAPIEPGCRKRDNGRRLEWLNAVLCTFFLNRLFNPYEPGAEDTLYKPHVRHRFARMYLGRSAATHETSPRRSHFLPEQRDYLRPADSMALSISHPKPDISWRTPWLYLFFPLLVWLLLL
jgi:hypothetical protein